LHKDHSGIFAAHTHQRKSVQAPNIHFHIVTNRSNAGGSAAISKQSLTRRLAQNVPGYEAIAEHPMGINNSHQVIHYALKLLDGVVKALSNSISPNSIYAPKDIKVVYALLDLISLEGIYQNVTPGLGIPLERRAKPQISSAFKANKGNTAQATDYTILTDICTCLDKFDRGGIHNDMLALIQDRTRADRLTARAELAFNPAHGSDGCKKQLYNALDQ